MIFIVGARSWLAGWRLSALVIRSVSFDDMNRFSQGSDDGRAVARAPSEGDLAAKEDLATAALHLGKFLQLLIWGATMSWEAGEKR